MAAYTCIYKRVLPGSTLQNDSKYLFHILSLATKLEMLMDEVIKVPCQAEAPS